MKRPISWAMPFDLRPMMQSIDGLLITANITRINWIRRKKELQLNSHWACYRGLIGSTLSAFASDSADSAIVRRWGLLDTIAQSLPAVRGCNKRLTTVRKSPPATEREELAVITFLATNKQGLAAKKKMFYSAELCWIKRNCFVRSRESRKTANVNIWTAARSVRIRWNLFQK